MATNQTSLPLLKKCEQSLCTFSQNGICMDGKGENCSYLKDVIDAEITPTPISETTSSAIKKSDIIRIASGEDLTDEMFQLLTYKVPLKLILLIGEPDCGKSTLFASLFDRFQKGAFGKYSFSATQTPIGFERRAHHARVVSQNTTSRTERTVIGEFTYLHLALERKDNGATSHILFADISGEKYKDARASDVVMKTINIVRYSSHVFLIANGELLLNGSRHHLRKSLVQFMDRAIKNNVFTSGQKVFLLITKWDKVLAADKESEARTYLVDYLQGKYPSFIDSEIFPVASRSVNPDYPAGSGLEAFLDQCTSKVKEAFIYSSQTRNQGNRIFQDYQFKSDDEKCK